MFHNKLDNGCCNFTFNIFSDGSLASSVATAAINNVKAACSHILLEKHRLANAPLALWHANSTSCVLKHVHRGPACEQLVKVPCSMNTPVLAMSDWYRQPWPSSGVAEAELNCFVCINLAPAMRSVLQGCTTSNSPPKASMQKPCKTAPCALDSYQLPPKYQQSAC